MVYCIHAQNPAVLWGSPHPFWQESDGKQPGKQVQGALKVSLRRLGLLGSHSDLEGGKQRLRSLVLLPACAALRACFCFFSSVPLQKPGLRSPGRSFQGPTDLGHYPSV